MNRSLGLASAGAVILVATSLVIACSSSDSTATPTGPQSTTAAVTGAPDTHCSGKPVVAVDPAACHPADAGDGREHGHDAGAEAGADAGAAPGEVDEANEYGATRFGSEGDDDECKYHVAWTSSPVAQNSDVTLQIVASHRADSSPVVGAEPYSDIFLDATHPGPTTDVKTVETSPGHYTVGPVLFDKAGKWNVRFHFSAGCADGDESPHGHVAFFVNVP